MTRTDLHWAILLLYIGTINAEDDVVILPLNSYLCENSDPLIEYDINVRNINDEGEKVLDFDLNLEQQFTEKWKFILKIDKWNNGAWDENFYNADGPVCQIVDQYVSRAWRNLRGQIEPNMEGMCAVDPGEYTLTDFEVDRKDYDIPVTILGRYRVTGKVLDEADTEMVCQVIEVETSKKG